MYYSDRWWALRAHPDIYPYVPRGFWWDHPKKYPRYNHPTQKKFTNSWFDSAFDNIKGRFVRAWRRYGLREGYAQLDLPYVEDVLNYKGTDNVAGYFHGYVGCRVEGQFYAVPVRWGWGDYGDIECSPDFRTKEGDVKPQYIERCTTWGLQEEHTPGKWRVSPSLWKKDGPGKIHFNLCITNVPDPAPWTIGKTRDEPRWPHGGKRYPETGLAKRDDWRGLWESDFPDDGGYCGM